MREPQRAPAAERRRAASTARTPTTSTPTPIENAVTMSTACTQKKDVGSLDQCSPAHARSSSAIAFAKRGQMTMLNSPASTRNHADVLEITRPV